MREPESLLGTGGRQQMLWDAAANDASFAQLSREFPWDEAGVNRQISGWQAAADDQVDRVTDKVPGIYKSGHIQMLWNAAANDEVRTESLGKPHPFDFVHEPFHRGKFVQQQRLKREIATGRHHVITDPRDAGVDFEPLKWMHKQGEPAAVQARGARALRQGAQA